MREGRRGARWRHSGRKTETAPRWGPRRARLPGGSGKIQSLKRAAAILDAVARKPEGISLAQLSAELGLHSTTAFTLIQTLVGLGFLIQDGDNRRYRIGMRLFTLAAGAMDETALFSLGTPLLERLSAESGHAAHLAVRSKPGHHRDCPHRRLRSPAARRPSRRDPPCPCDGNRENPAGSDAARGSGLMLKTLPLPAFTPNTMTDPATLPARSKGFAAQASLTTIANWTLMSAVSQCRFMILPGAARRRWASPVPPGA